MHPAISVILLTTLIGAGQGLFLALFTAQVYSLFKILPLQDIDRFYGEGAALAVALLVAGLVASFFHLGHPERAWRAAARWRTSWLSREVIVLPVTALLIALWGGAHYLALTRPLFTLPGGTPVDLTLILGVLATVAAFALYLCTAMIYASLKFLQEWHHPLTVINYVLLGSASGFAVATALAALRGVSLTGFFAGWALAFTLLAFLTRGASVLRNRRLRPKSTLKSAIGVRHTRLAQKAQGAMGGSFNTREFFHGRSALFVRNVRRIFFTLAFAVPALLFAGVLAWPRPDLALAAVAVQYLGLLAERWYFFAEANHPQNLYYQQIA